MRAEAGGVKKMSNLEMIARMSEMLELAAALIRDQAALLSQHGIQTSTGNLEQMRTKLLEDIEKSI